MELELLFTSKEILSIDLAPQYLRKELKLSFLNKGIDKTS